jgi:hypothetical protein
MKTLKAKLLSGENLKKKTSDELTDIDSPLPINVKDLDLPKTVTLEEVVPRKQEEIKNTSFWKDLLRLKT